MCPELDSLHIPLIRAVQGELSALQLANLQLANLQLAKLAVPDLDGNSGRIPAVPLGENHLPGGRPQHANRNFIATGPHRR